MTTNTPKRNAPIDPYFEALVTVTLEKFIKLRDNAEAEKKLQELLERELQELLERGQKVHRGDGDPVFWLAAGLQQWLVTHRKTGVPPRTFTDKKNAYFALLARNEARKGNLELAYRAALRLAPIPISEAQAKEIRSRMRHWGRNIIRALVLLIWEEEINTTTPPPSVASFVKRMAPVAVEISAEIAKNTGRSKARRFRLTPDNAERTIVGWIRSWEKEEQEKQAKMKELIEENIREAERKFGAQAGAATPKKKRIAVSRN